MNDKIQIIENSERYYLEKVDEIKGVLNLSNRKFLENTYNFKKIIDLKKEPNFIFLVTGWIAQTSLLMQIKNPVDNFIKQDILNMITGYYSNLSFEEIIKAFELERFGVYKEKTEHYQLFDTAYISQVFKKYQQWKREQKLEFKIEAPMSLPEITEQEKENILINGINNKYNEYITTNDIQEPFSHIFNELIERGILLMPTQNTPRLSSYYNTKLELATKEVLDEMKSFGSEDKSKRNEAKSIIESILSENKNDLAKAKIEIRAKKLVLIDFFNKQIKLKKDKIL